MAAGQGLVYGQQQDKADAEEQRIQQAREREERLNQAWLGMFNQGQPSSSSSDMARAGTPPIDLTGAFARGPHFASGSPCMTGQERPAMAAQTYDRWRDGGGKGCE